MKKGNLFGNLLKQLSFSLLISCFTLSGSFFVNGAKIQPVGIGYDPSIYNSQYEITALKYGDFITNYLGYGKGILALDNNMLFWWTELGQPYFYGPRRQGFFSHYSVCDQLTGYESTLNNCSWSEMTGDYYNIFKNFLRTITTDDLIYYDYEYYLAGNQCTSKRERTIVCFSSNQIGKTLCYNVSNCYNGCGGGNSLCNSYCQGNTCGGTWTNSQQLTNVTFNTIEYSRIYRSPGVYIDNMQQQTTTNNNYTCPTIQQLINTYSSNYNTGLCYSNNTILSGMQLIQVTPKTIFQLFPTWSDYNNAIQLYYNYCETPATTESCNIAFAGTTGTQQYQIIAKNVKSKTDTTQKGIYTYCNYQLNIPDKNATTCTLNTGTTQVIPIEQITNEDIVNNIINGNYNTVTPQNETVFDQIKMDGAGQGNTEGWNINRNIIDSIDNIYTKITGLFKGRAGKNGIIPEYITRIILLFIFIAMFK